MLGKPARHTPLPSRGLPHPDPFRPVMPPGPDGAEGAPKRRLPPIRAYYSAGTASPIKWLAARPVGAAISARPVSDSNLRPHRRRHSQRASSRSAQRACMAMHDQPVPKTHGFAASGCRLLVWPAAGRAVRLGDCRLRHLRQPEDRNSPGRG
jgi:hypothetical protein